VGQLCRINNEARVLSEDHGIEVYSVDEKCGMQALERAAGDLPISQGRVRRRECNYVRHGTQTLIAGLHVASGEVCASVGQTRTEEDFEAFIRFTVEQHHEEQVKLLFIADQLNTHKSESLVRLVARLNGDHQDLGIKGKKGILRSMKTRMAYLEGTVPDQLCQQQTTIRFVYTPKHCSWLNVVEGWFSGLQKRLLSLASLKSTDELAERVLAYVDYYNLNWAKMINWPKAKKEEIDKLLGKVKRLVSKLSG
jgi:putative transposase